MNFKLKHMIMIMFVFMISYRFFLSGSLMSYASYLMDAVNVVLFVNLLYTFKTKFFKRGMGILVGPTVVVLLMLLIVVFSYIINGQSAVVLIWGIRSLFRFYMFFYNCAFYLDKEDYKKVINIFTVFLYINVLVCSYQYFVLGLVNDYIGGTFGSLVKGGNTYLNILLIVVVAYKINEYMVREISGFSIASIIVSAMYIAVLAELKAFFFLFVMIMGIAIVLNKPSVRIAIAFSLAAIAVYLAILNFAKYNPAFVDFFTLDAIKGYIGLESSSEHAMSGYGGYTGSGLSINRATALQVLTTNFMNDIATFLFGVGLGDADYTNFFVGTFYAKYGYLKYAWFTHAIILIENGWLGFTCYLSFFVVVLIEYLRNVFINVNITDTEKAIYRYGVIIVAVSLVLVIYDLSLRTEAAMLLYFSYAYLYVDKIGVLREEMNIGTSRLESAQRLESELISVSKE